MTSEDVLAADLNRLSFKQRNQIMEEIHGVNERVSETPEFVAQSLAALKMALNEIPVKPAYDMAVKRNRAYITKPKFCLMFLRAELFDPQRAAVRLVEFLETKLELFGRKTLTRSLYLSDLDSDSMEMLKSGVHQILPVRTRSGKIVPCSSIPIVPAPYDTPESILKSYFYLITTHAESDEESQKHGAVVVVYFPGKAMTKRLMDVHEKLGDVDVLVPMRTTGIHFCSEADFFKPVKNLFVAAITQATRIRLRFHDGSLTECQYSLMTFGIPVKHLPLGVSSIESRNSTHLKWISKHRARERQLKRSGHFDGIDIPGIHDVLLGRGRLFQDHAGNILMRELISAKLDDFKAGSSSEKDRVVNEVLKTIQSQQGRFLTRDKNGWFEEVAQSSAVEKVSSSFRTMVCSVNKVQQQQRQSPTFLETTPGKRAKIFGELEPRCSVGCF